LELAAARVAKDALEQQVLLWRQPVRAVRVGVGAVKTNTCALWWFTAVEQIAGCARRGCDGDDRGQRQRVFLTLLVDSLLFFVLLIVVLTLQFIFFSL
jgi:hypothetical protein